MDAALKMIALADISADPANVRRHSPRNVEAIKASLRRFGQQKPIVVDFNNVVRAGNGTLAAARELGWAEIAVVRTNLAGADAAAYAIADNRTAELAEWDQEGLAAQMAGLDEELKVAAGFAEGELAQMLGAVAQGAGAAEADLAVQEVYQIAVTCRDEAEQRELFERLKAEGWECRVLTL